MSIELVADAAPTAAADNQAAVWDGTDPAEPINSGWSADKIKTDAWLLAPPGSPYRGATIHLLELLGMFPGETWQDRWVLFEASCDGVEDWHALLSKASTQKRRHYAHWTMELLTARAVIRPSYAWMQQGRAQLGLRFLRLRDPAGLAEVSQAMAAASISERNISLTLNALALIMARTGKMTRQLDAPDLLGLRDFSSSTGSRAKPGLHTAWRSLKLMGIFEHESTSMPIANRRNRQRTPDELVDAYQLIGPLREPIVEYLRQRSVSLDHSSLRNLSYYLAKAFCGDLLAHHPDLDTFKLTREQAAGWKERIAFHADGRPRQNHIGALFLIRAFYLDMAEWSVHDPLLAALVRTVSDRTRARQGLPETAAQDDLEDAAAHTRHCAVPGPARCPGRDRPGGVGADLVRRPVSRRRRDDHDRRPALDGSTQQRLGTVPGLPRGAAHPTAERRGGPGVFGPGPLSRPCAAPAFGWRRSSS